MQSAAKIIQFPQPKPTKPAPKKHASGLFRLSFRFKDPVTGKASRKDVYGKNKSEAERKKKAFLAHVEQGLRVNEQGRTTAQWADEWLLTYKKNSVKPTTFAVYKADVERIKDFFGERPLTSVVENDVIRFMDLRRGLSASAIKKTFMAVNAVFETAVNNRLIPFNPCRGVTPPTGTVGTHRALEQWEIDLILEVARQGHRFALYVLLMLFAGLRRGEAVAVHKEDIDGDVLHVCRAAYWIGNAPHIGDTKSAAGVRSVPIFEPLRLPLEAFLAAPDEPIMTLTAFNRGFQSFVYACEEQLNGCAKRWRPTGHKWRTFDIRPHDLRHTFATIIYNAGVDVKTAQVWLGHASPEVTLKIYTHLTSKREQIAADAAGQFIGKMLDGGKNDGKNY